MLFDPVDWGYTVYDCATIGCSALEVTFAVLPGVSGSLGKAGKFVEMKKLAGLGEVPHHMPQKALGFTSEVEGGALIILVPEHKLTRTYGYKGAVTKANEASLPFREVLARDIADIRQIAGSSYNAGIKELLAYYRQNFPFLIGK